MTATNHALTGAIIGLTIANPAALPIALLSHYVLDVIPHFGWPEPEEKRLKTNLFRNYLITEALVCFLLVTLLFVVQPSGWLIASICAFLAAAPDLASYPRYATTRAGKVFKPNAYERFAGKIQWFERPIGAVVEVAWFIACVVTLAIYL